MATPLGHGFSVGEVRLPHLLSLGMVKRDTALEFHKQFKNITGDSIVAELEAAGKVDEVHKMDWGMQLDFNKPFNSFRVTADATVTNSGQVTVTILDYSDDTKTLSAPEVGLFFVDNATGVEYEVISVNKGTAGAHTAVIKPTKSGVSTTITIADSHFISLGRPTVQESSFQQAGEYSGWTTRWNELSMIRTNKQYSDLASMVYVENVGGQDFMSFDKTDLPRQHTDKKEKQLIEGDKRNAVTSTGNRNTNAMGLLPLVKEYGTTLDGGGTGIALTDAFFENLHRTVDGNGYASSYKGIADTEAMIKVGNFLKAQNGVNVNLQLTTSDDEIKAIFDYNTNFTYYGVDYSFKKYAYWNAQRIAGADNSKSYMSNQILFVPEGGALNGKGEYQDFLRLKVLNNNLPTDEGFYNHFDTDGALFGKNTTRNAELSVESYMGIDVLGVDGFVYCKLA